MTMHAYQSMTTKIRRASNGRVRVTLPKALVPEVGIRDSDDHHVHSAVRCSGSDDELSLVLSHGPGVDPKATNASTASVRERQVEIELPVFQALAWNLIGRELEWPERVETDEDGTVRLCCRVLDWEPVHEVDIFTAISGGFAYRTSLSLKGEKRAVEGSFPFVPAEQVGLVDSEIRAEITFDCIDGRVVLVATPTDASTSGVPNSVAVNIAGAKSRQARFNGIRLSAELGILDVLAERSVPLRWVRDGERLVGFVDERGDDAE